MAVSLPQYDTTAFLDEFRAADLSHLLVAAVSAFDVGTALAEGGRSFEDLRQLWGLAERPAIVLLTAVRSLGLIEVDDAGRLALTPYGREKLSPQSPFHLRGYLALGAFSADVQQMIACLRADRPTGGVSFVFHDDGTPSALDDPETAHVLARAMADRARSIAPFLALHIDLPGATSLVDVGGGHGLYSYALLNKHPSLRATIIDRQPALEVAREYAAGLNLADRVQFVAGNVHTIELDQPVDAVLIANVLHDYSASHAAALVRHYARQLAPGGRLMILDALLRSIPPGAPPVADGPREVAAYSGLLFTLCEGRCYRLDEVQAWLRGAGLEVDDQIPSTPAHGSVVSGWKR